MINLETGDGRGDGNGYGDGDGQGDGMSYGIGDGHGFGNGDGDGDGGGYSNGYGYGCGFDCGARGRWSWRQPNVTRATGQAQWYNKHIRQESSGLNQLSQSINSKDNIMAKVSSSTVSPIETLQINGVDYIRADSVQAPGPELGPTQIVVADKGFVFVGNVEDHVDGSVTIRNCRNIRYWGTTRGLGELTTGPTAKTLSDPYGTVKLIPILRIAVVSGW